MAPAVLPASSWPNIWPRVANSDLKWAMAGRSLDKLATVRDAIGAPPDTPLIAADASDPASLKAMIDQTRLVLTTVGPYQLYGSELVAACAASGTDYLDLCGEPLWMRQMIDAHEATAKSSGARIVFSCGFDSLPFELGVFFCEATAKKILGAPVSRVKGRVRDMKGSVLPAAPWRASRRPSWPRQKTSAWCRCCRTLSY